MEFNGIKCNGIKKTELCEKWEWNVIYEMKWLFLMKWNGMEWYGMVWNGMGGCVCGCFLFFLFFG